MGLIVENPSQQYDDGLGRRSGDETGTEALPVTGEETSLPPTATATYAPDEGDFLYWDEELVAPPLEAAGVVTVVIKDGGEYRPLPLDDSWLD